MKIAVLGLGFLGTTIFETLKKTHEVVGITRKNYDYHKGEQFDVFINANGNSKKYLAEQDPIKDFELSVLSVYKSLYDFKFKKYIYISSSDVWNNNIYGNNKSIAETIIRLHLGLKTAYKFIRCPSIIGKGMKKGVLYDILHDKPLYVTLDSLLQFVTVEEVVNHVVKALKDYRDITDLATTNIKVRDIYKVVNKPIIEPQEGAEYQVYNQPPELEKTSEQYIKEIL